MHVYFALDKETWSKAAIDGPGPELNYDADEACPRGPHISLQLLFCFLNLTLYLFLPPDMQGSHATLQSGFLPTLPAKAL